MQWIGALVYKTDGYGTNETIDSLMKLPWHLFLALSYRHGDVVKAVKKANQEAAAKAKSARKKAGKRRR